MNIILKRSQRAKRTSIRVRLGSVILTVAARGSISKAYEFLNSHLDSLQTRLESFKPVIFKDGTILKILGREYTIVYSKKIELKNVELLHNELIVSSVVKDHQAVIEKFLYNYLKQIIMNMAESVCAELSVKYLKISVKNMYSKWGSCSSSGSLSFCWKLVFFDEEIVRYVVVHEICHLKEMNHSKNFWALVESIYPDWQSARAWLKKEGAKIL